MTKTEIKFSREFPCWLCGEYYIKGWRLGDGSLKINCPYCGEVHRFSTTTTMEQAENYFIKKIDRVPKDPVQRAEHLKYTHATHRGRVNMGAELWASKGWTEWSWTEYIIKPTEIDGKKTLVISDQDGEHEVFLHSDNAKWLRDALNRYFGDE